MIVVVWYPGAMEDLRESIEDLTEAVRRNYQYDSPLGFPVLQYKPDSQFSTSLAQAVLKVQPFSISNITMDTRSQPEEPREPEPESNLVSAMKRFGGQEIEVISVHPQSDQEEDQEVEQEVDQEEQEQVLVTDPVVLIVGPPGHGKSSIGNLILGGEHFQIR